MSEGCWETVVPKKEIRLTDTEWLEENAIPNPMVLGRGFPSCRFNKACRSSHRRKQT